VCRRGSTGEAQPSTGQYDRDEAGREHCDVGDYPHAASDETYRFAVPLNS
jgi:hypothetical protein